MISIFVENGRILGKSTKGAKFLLILKALFGHQPTYKNLRGNTVHHTFLQSGKQQWRYKAIVPSIVLSQQRCEVSFISLTVANPLRDLTSTYY